MIEKDNVQRTSKGLHLDNSYIDQPKDTYRFALNSVNETELGDFAFLSNEESNELCAQLKPSFIPIGKVYTTSNEIIVFSVSEDETTSEIGIINDNCQYTEIMNDSTSSLVDKLNFKVTHQIQATYRLRRGCERTIYFTDDYNKPRYFNIDKPFDFKNPDGTWSGKAFNLFKEYNLIPTFNDVEVMDSGGILEPGGYNMAIQYLDEGLNPTEWIVSSPLVKVYNDLSTEEFLNIRGSINSDVDYKMFPKTSKAIKVEFGNLDPSFSFYRIAFIESTNGSGNVSCVKYTDVIPTSKDYFIYTGENAASNGTEEEILFFNDIIYKAQSIEQIENRLILGNTQGKQVNFCKLQKYASRIKADCITQKVILNSITDPRNSKNPTMEFGDMLTGGLGYMPGEIYSFGIVYVFEDGSLSPVYHIPGKNTTIDPLTVFDPAPHTYPMSAVNESTNARYIDNDSCSNNIYWGYDSEGVPLEGRPIRHHRFPFRSAINVPLVQEESSSGPNISSYYQLKVNATGTVTLPCTQAMIDNSECTTLVNSPRFDIKVEYTVDGIAGTFSFYINPSLYVGGTGAVNENFLSNIYTTNNIVVTAIKETLDGINYTTVPSGTTSPKGMLYTTSVVPNQTSSESKLYSTEILGIKFSGVDIPDLADTNGEKIIGYYIVRNERIENEKTILDTGVLTPTLQNNKYISTGLLQPESGDTSRINKRVFGLIHPEYKFLDRQYPIYDYIKQEGNFDIIERKRSKFRYNDVQDGSSYDGSVHKHGNDDGHDAGDPDRGYDGWCLKVIVRDNITKFVQRTNFNVQASDIEDTFYLKAVESKNINQGANTVYNIASDNRAGILQTKTDIINPIQENLPYVVIGRNIADSYSNFRTLSYYRDSLNLEVNNKAILYSGDTYVTPMRYVTTTFWENRVARRAGQTSAWSYIAGAILIVVGAVLTFFTAGASTLVIGAGIALIGAGALFISSGINKDSLVKAYGEEYAKGLRQTALDDYTSAEYGYGPQYGCCNGYDGPSDDEIQWIGDCITDLWFDSTINMSLRNGMISDVPTFIDAPGVLETGNTSPENAWEFFGLHYWSSNSRYPISKLEYHLMNKLTAYNSSRRDNRQYLGAALGEYYEINLDYLRKNKQKIYHHLPLEYDCCTECMEDFPHRIHYSEQSFQEELTDNYRIFLPNNYKDIEGETGEIKNIFKIGNDLFIHTLEGLWQMPRSYQERVTDQISSFIGTGSYFEIPPQKIIDDDNGSSAGTQHKWSSIKTPNGYFFVCENQRKIYQFDGKQLKPISNIGLSNWFKEHTRLAINQQYYNTTGNIYTYNDNPSNLFGSGFISTYDTKKERILFTKKDFLFSPDIIDTPDYELCIQNGQVILFPNYNTIISTEEANGWNYLGLENCRMKFSKDVIKHRTEIREVTTIVNLSNKADIHVFYDTSGSFDGQGLQDIRDAVADWVANFASTNTSWTGNLYEYNNPTERWVNFLEVAIGTTYSGVDLSTKDVILITFVNEANDSYHGGGLENPINGFTGTFQGDYNTFVSRINTTTTPSTSKLNSFIGVNYPIAFSFGGYDSMSKCYVEHCLAAIQGATFTATEAAAIPVNPGFTTGEWNTMLAALQGSNPYSTLGTSLKDYGWRIIPNRYWNGSNTVLTSQQFQDDITALLAGFTQVVVTQVETDVTYIETEYEYIDGTVVENPIELNNSWTMSYSIKQGTWTSWHSYLPNFYMNVPEKFYSWRYGDNNIWKHNRLADYQTYYGIYKPHIIEYVSLSTPIITRLWNHFRLITEAKVYNTDYEQYVDDRFTTFNKAILYNSRQCTGELNLKVKDTDYNQQDWFANQTINENNNDIIIEKREKDWNINDLRDIRSNYNLPIWDSKLSSVQSEYFIDKVLNTSTLDINKDWTQLESFRDKYLVIRLIFDKFAKERTTASNIKLITNYSTENEQQSFS